MFMDNQLLFSNAASLTASAGQLGSTAIDLAGGSTLNTGLAATFGEDLGIGNGVGSPRIFVNVGTALTSTNSATLQIQFQGSTNSTSWTTYIESPAIAAAALTANTKVWDVAWPVRLVGAALPRYVRLNYTVGTGSFSTGTVTAGVVLDSDLQQYHGPAYSAA